MLSTVEVAMCYIYGCVIESDAKVRAVVLSTWPSFVIRPSFRESFREISEAVGVVLRFSY